MFYLKKYEENKYFEDLTVMNNTALQKTVSQRLTFKLDAINKTRGHKLKLNGNRFKTDIEKYWFANRIIGPWNELTESVIESDSINAF